MKPFARAGRADKKAGTRSRAGIARTLFAGAAVAAVSAVAAVPASAEVEPGRNLEINHSIQLAVMEGWELDQTVRVDVFRGTTLIATKTGQVGPGPKPGQTVFEVNHVGPAGDDCWEGGPAGTTPDVIPGDKVVTTVIDPTTGLDTADVDYTFVRDIAFNENGAGLISGHARGVETSPGVFNLALPVTPDVDVMEAKRVAGAVFDYPFTGADLDANGNFANIEVGGDPGDGELFIDYLDGSGGGTGNTVTNRASDPVEVPCGPLQQTALTDNSHPTINTGNVGTPMEVGGPELGPTQVIGLTFDSFAYDVVHGDGVWSATIPAAALDALAEGSHELIATFDVGPPQTLTVVKDITAPALSASPPAGTYTGAQAVALSSDGGEVVRYTLDGSAPGNTSRAYDGTPISLAPGSHTLRAFSIDAAGNRTDVTFAYTINAPAGAGGAGGAGGQVGGAGAGGAAGGGTAGDVLARITGLRAIRLTLRQARRRGITVSFNVPDGARFVRVTLFRQTNAARHNTRRLVVRRTFAVSRSGRHTVRINDRRTRRKLRRGRYVIQVAPGLSVSSFQEATARRFTIR